MKYSYAILGLVLFGMFGLVFVVMFESITINNESEYYVLKEAMEAAMLESVDTACFRNSNIGKGCYGQLKISEQKFIENFTRRFVASVNGDVSQYTIEFYDIIEKPAKATVVIKGKTQTYQLSIDNNDSSFDLVNNLSGILEIGERNYNNVFVYDAEDSSVEGEEAAIDDADGDGDNSEIPGSGNIPDPTAYDTNKNGAIEKDDIDLDNFNESGRKDSDDNTEEESNNDESNEDSNSDEISENNDT